MPQCAYWEDKTAGGSFFYFVKQGSLNGKIHVQLANRERKRTAAETDG
jgi:hypothetical protein